MSNGNEQTRSSAWSAGREFAAGGGPRRRLPGWPRGTHVNPNLVWLAAVGLAATCAVTLIAFPLDGVPWIVAFVLSAGFVCCSALFVRSLRRDLLQPGAVVVVWFAIYCFFAPMISFARGRANCPNAYEYVPAAMVLSAMAFMLFLLTYGVIVDRYGRGRRIYLARPPGVGGAFLLVLLCWVGALAEAASYQGLIARAYGVQGYQIMLIPALALLVAGDIVRCRRKKWPVFPLVVPAVCIALAYGEIVYSKEALVMLFVVTSVLGYLLARPFVNPGRIVELSGVVLLLGLVYLSFPLVTYTRAHRSSGRGLDLSQLSANVLANTENGTEYVSRRLGVIEFLAGTLRNEDTLNPSRPPNRSHIFTGWILTNIPRLLWPGKPIPPNNAYEIGRQLGVLKHPGVSNVAVTIVGDLLWHYGFIFVVLGMMFLGAATGWVYVYFARLCQVHWGFTIAYFGCLGCFMGLETGVNSYVTATVRILVVVGVFRLLQRGLGGRSAALYRAVPAAASSPAGRRLAVPRRT